MWGICDNMTGPSTNTLHTREHTPLTGTRPEFQSKAEGFFFSRICLLKEKISLKVAVVTFGLQRVTNRKQRRLLQSEGRGERGPSKKGEL